jgi:hypothetical protein
MTQRTNLESLTQLRDKLVPGRRRPRGTGRKDDLERHLAKLRTEFAREPELCFELARTIVLIRREIDLARNLRRFYEILEFDPEFLWAALSKRWLVSVGDTIADHGNARERNAALCIGLFVNLVKLAEAEHLMRSTADVSPERYME